MSKQKEEPSVVYGHYSESWSEYTALTRRMQYTRIPTSNQLASATVVDGFVLQSTDNTGITTSQRRSYTSSGMSLSQTDGRGNTKSTETDLAGRIVKEPDAARATRTTVNDPCFDLPSCITNALGYTACYSYDIRGRKIAEYGTAIQPACFSYDAAGRMLSLTTFRNPGEDITTDPSGRTDGDTTRWTYDEATGRQLKKTYADGSELIDTYDAMKRPDTRTLARGIVINYSYNPLTGETIQIHYSDATPDFTYDFNHLGQIVTIHTEGEEHPYYPMYNDYGVMIGDGYWMGWQESYVTRTYDAFGRPSSVRIDLQNSTPIKWGQTYDDHGRISSFRLLENEAREFEEKTFQFNYLPGSNLVSRIDWSNGLCLEYTYQSWRDILTGIRCGTSNKTYTIAEKTRELDPLGRPEKGLRTRLGETHDDYFSYNLRNELTGAMFGGGPVFEYKYDNIGNREQFQVRATQTDYESNELNQYSLITPSYAPAFTPTFDADGNQTRIRTTSGIWNVSYNANNRPVRFASEDNETVIECRYDHMGRRVTKKVSAGGIVTQHEGYHYLDYIQVAAVNLLANNEILHTILWNPLEPLATRPLAIIRNNAIYYSAHDFVKNITEWINEQGEISASFDYTPYGGVMSETGDSSLNVIGYSSEVMDHELGLVYYNHRHLNPLDGRWISRDPIMEKGGLNLYEFARNNIYLKIDYMGLLCWPWSQRPPAPPATESQGCNDADLVEPNPEAKNACNQILERTKQDIKITSLIEKLQKINGCNVPIFVCKCCSGKCSGAGAWHFSDKIVFCTNGNQNSRTTPQYILHELTHRLQKCENRTGQCCTDSLKNEVEAYRTSSTDCGKIIENAISSSLLGGQCQNEDITDQVKQELLNYCQQLS